MTPIISVSQTSPAMAEGWHPAATGSVGFGPHLMLDCRQCHPGKIGDVAYVFEVLKTLPAQVGMTAITQPYVFPYAGLVPEDRGVTGMVVIAESHLSFHSFTEKDYFFFDLFSCKPFAVDAAVQFVLKAFEVNHWELHYAERGRYFPRGTPGAPPTRGLPLPDRE
ncbi:S-adenosylmethionine decarboxylase [Vampirovibrio chlorellavorus]|uniref:S-adenosylmethionine decarboxylase n=1 Tax=Vampirovibrio chlorellavorus TaxID=758823 RepID=UPI0026EFFF24|nr:S-adenosylmethionine decarboxylase [Vampirovibrio chlorellavorus]